MISRSIAAASLILLAACGQGGEGAGEGQPDTAVGDVSTGDAALSEAELAEDVALANEAAAAEAADMATYGGNAAAMEKNKQ